MKLLAKIIIVIAVFVGGFYFGQKQALSPTDGSSATLEQVEIKEGIEVSLMFDFGNGEIKTYSQVSLFDKATVFDLLKKATTENNLEFSYKDYGGELGVFVESIAGIGNDLGANKFWQYWVNNEYAQIGASNYQLADGDVVEWKFVRGQM